MFFFQQWYKKRTETYYLLSAIVLLDRHK